MLYDLNGSVKSNMDPPNQKYTFVHSCKQAGRHDRNNVLTANVYVFEVYLSKGTFKHAVRPNHEWEIQSCSLQTESTNILAFRK